MKKQFYCASLLLLLVTLQGNVLHGSDTGSESDTDEYANLAPTETFAQPQSWATSVKNLFSSDEDAGFLARCFGLCCVQRAMTGLGLQQHYKYFIWAHENSTTANFIDQLEQQKRGSSGRWLQRSLQQAQEGKDVNSIDTLLEIIRTNDKTASIDPKTLHEALTFIKEHNQRREVNVAGIVSGMQSALDNIPQK